MKTFNKGSRGFTLIELLVVIAIIGLLSSVVLASLNTARTKARDAKRIGDVKQIQLALEMYYDSNSSYPATYSAALPTTTGLPAVKTAGFIPNIPKDPKTGTGYEYAAKTDGSTFVLKTTLENKNNILKTDIDGTVLTITCDDPYSTPAATTLFYCIQP